MSYLSFEYAIEDPETSKTLETVEVQVWYHLEHEHYGADRDGNRGEDRTSIAIDDIQVYAAGGTRNHGLEDLEEIQEAAYSAACDEEPSLKRRFA